jgi:hypothetical protein
VTAVQPRIVLTRSFDERSHSYLGYVLRLEGVSCFPWNWNVGPLGLA